MVCGGDLFVKALKREGVRYIFTLSGGHIAPIYNACYDEGIQIIDVRHEQIAAHAADGWARVTGEPGVAVVTAGPGVTDSVSGVAEAFMAGSPLIEFGGRAPLKKFEMGALQDLDQVRLMEPITKWAKTVYEAKRIPDYVSIAFRKAKSGTPGPVYLECPIDILMQKVEESDVAFPENYYAEQEANGNPALIKEAIELLMAAERPAVIAGNGLCADSKFIQVSIDPDMIGYNRGVDIGILGSPKAVLKQMIDESKATKKKAKSSAWLSQIRALDKATEEQAAEAYSATSLPVHPARLAKEVVEFLDKDAVMVRDGADCTYWFMPIVKAQAMGQVLTTTAFGCLGAGTGFALAAKLANRDKQVLLYYGDGTFGLNGMEFDTFVRHNLPIVSVISNDSAWGMVKHMHRMWYGENRLTGTLLKPGQRYDKVVEALGGYGEYVTKIEDIKPALARAFASGLPACINVEVDPRPAHPVTMALDRHMGLLDIGQ